MAPRQDRTVGKQPPPVLDPLRAFAAVMSSIGIEPDAVDVSMPFESWQRLSRQLGEEGHDEPGGDINKVRVAGVAYRVRRRDE